MIKCGRCGTTWKDQAPDHWDSEMKERFSEGRGCPECAGLDDRQAANRLEALLSNKAGSLPSRSRADRVPGVSSILDFLGLLDIIGGVVLFVVSLGQKDLLGHVNIRGAVTWLLAGLSSGAFLIGAGEAFRDLRLMRLAATSCVESQTREASRTQADEPRT